jgi:hypothetical protein
MKTHTRKRLKNRQERQDAPRAINTIQYKEDTKRKGSRRELTTPHKTKTIRTRQSAKKTQFHWIGRKIGKTVGWRKKNLPASLGA